MKTKESLIRSHAGRVGLAADISFCSLLSLCWHRRLARTHRFFTARRWTQLPMASPGWCSSLRRLLVSPFFGWYIFCPKKIAEKKRHPADKGHSVSLPAVPLLWRIALADRVALGLYQPVLHKMAYGTDVDESHGHGHEELTEGQKEIEKLRARVGNSKQKPDRHGVKAWNSFSLSSTQSSSG